MLLRKRDIKPGVLVKRLKPWMDRLKEELDKGLSPELKRGEATEEVNFSLKFLEIALERTIGELEDYDRMKDANALRKRIPRRHEGRRTAEAKTEPGKDGKTEPAKDAKAPPAKDAEEEEATKTT